MEYGNEDWLCVNLEDFSPATESGSSRGRMSGKRNYDDDTREYKSKNLVTERRRREKLSNRLLMLRSIVPIITNMNKATIIEDAITYIKELQDKVQSLSQELHKMEMEATSDETAATKIDEIDATDTEDMKKWGIETEVRVAQIDANKLWVKIITENKRGRFKKLMEAMNKFGFELIETNLTTTKGALLITGCMQVTPGKVRIKLNLRRDYDIITGRVVYIYSGCYQTHRKRHLCSLYHNMCYLEKLNQGMDGERLAVYQIKKLLQDIISDI